jgi:hypothetical protein
MSKNERVIDGIIAKLDSKHEFHERGELLVELVVPYGAEAGEHSFILAGSMAMEVAAHSKVGERVAIAITNVDGHETVSDVR